MIQALLRVLLLVNSWCCALPALIQTSISQLTGGQQKRIQSQSQLPFVFVLSIYALPRYLYYQSFGIDACFCFK